jgi:hypothetical protein
MGICMENDYLRILTQSEIDELFLLDAEVLANILVEIRKFEDEIAASILEKINNEPCGHETCLCEITVNLMVEYQPFLFATADPKITTILNSPSRPNSG